MVDGSHRLGFEAPRVEDRASMHPNTRKVRIPAIIGVLIVASAASACSSGIAATPSLTPNTVLPSASAASSDLATPPVAPTSELQPFTSSAYAYTVSYPSNWNVREATTQISSIQTPHDFDPGIDYFSATAPETSDPALVIAGPEVEAGKTLDEWVADVERDASGVGCDAPDAEEDTQLGGGAASILTWYDCHAFLLWAAAVHGDHAYHVIWVDMYARGNPALQSADKALFQAILASFAFTD